jgi:hypothetical protein
MWTYKSQLMEALSSFPQGTYGFIYRTTHISSGKAYIGKKVLYHQKKVKLTKKELAEYAGVSGRKPSYRIAMKESDWQKYYGSHSEIKELIKEGKQEDFEREILQLADSKKLLTYYEVKYQMLYQVLEKPEEFFNDNILGKFYRKDFE